MKNEELFPKRLKELRKASGLTQTALGEIAGVKAQAMNEMEHGRNYPSYRTLVALADYFDVSLDYLVGRSDSPKRL
jgi:transcriptional regulator with XRE-family HTH domain